MIRRCRSALAFAGILAISAAVAAQEKKVLIIGIDGCRPDALQVADTPNLDALIAAGAVSYEAQTGDITVSGPGWSSMLTAVWRDKHGVDDNSFSGSNFGRYPHLFTRLKEIDPGLTTASIVNWSPINTEILSDGDFVLSGLSDSQVSTQAASHLANQDPDAVFVHFDQIDGAGHGCCYDPANEDYLNAIEAVDTLVGPLIEAIEGRPTFGNEDWLVIVSTDHGGSGTSHGANTPEHRTIFVIVSGPSACHGQIVPAPGVVDVAATAVAHFGPIDPAWDWDGQAVGLDNCIDGTCAQDLLASVDHVAGTVQLTWAPVAGIDAAGIDIRRNGELIVTLDTSATQHVDTPALGNACGHVSLSYEVGTTGGDEGDLCPTLDAQVIFSSGDVRLADDFEAYATDAELQAAGWRIVDENDPVETSTFTVTNPAGRGNPARFDGKPTQGRFLISDSDIGGTANPNPTGSGMSHDVWSPVFNCVGMDQVWLHMDCAALLNNNGKAVFDIDVSTDFGSQWTNVFRRVAPARTEAAPFASTSNADGYYGRLDVDLTPLAAGEPQVWFRVRHFEPSWDWWLAFDNVIVDDLPLVAGGSQTLLGPEAFDAGIPIGWTLLGNNSGNDTWNTNDPCTRSIVTAGASFPYNDGRAIHRLGTDFAILDSDCNPDPAEDEHLVTPPVDCTAASLVYLHYRTEIVTSAAATEEVLLSLDGGASFLPEPVFSYAGGGLTLSEEPAYAERVLCVPAAAGQANVAFAFRYASSGNQWFWGIDDVRISVDIGIPGDVNGDGVVNVNDLLEVILQWGVCPLPPSSCTVDLNGDGTVNVTDLIEVILNWS